MVAKAEVYDDGRSDGMGMFIGNEVILGVSSVYLLLGRMK